MDFDEPNHPSQSQAILSWNSDSDVDEKPEILPTKQSVLDDDDDLFASQTINDDSFSHTQPNQTPSPAKSLNIQSASNWIRKLQEPSPQSSHDSNKISSVGSSQALPDDKDDTILYTSHAYCSRRKRKRTSGGLADAWRKIHSQELSDRNLRQHFVQDSSQKVLTAKVLNYEIGRDGLARFRCQEEQTNGQTEFELLVNLNDSKGELKPSDVKSYLEIHKPWNEYLLKNGLKLIFNPNKIKHI